MWVFHSRICIHMHCSIAIWFSLSLSSCSVGHSNYDYNCEWIPVPLIPSIAGSYRYKLGSLLLTDKNKRLCDPRWRSWTAVRTNEDRDGRRVFPVLKLHTKFPAEVKKFYLIWFLSGFSASLRVWGSVLKCDKETSWKLPAFSACAPVADLGFL